MTTRISAQNNTLANVDLVKVSDGYQLKFNGTCIAKFKSDGDLIIKGIIETENNDPCL